MVVEISITISVNKKLNKLRQDASKSC